MKRVPFAPFSYKKSRRLARPFFGLAELLLQFNQSMEIDMAQADLDYDPTEYTAVALFTTVFYFLLMSGSFLFINWMVDVPPYDAAGSSFTFGAVAAFIVLLLMMIHPKTKVQQRKRAAEKDLLFSLRHLLIEVKSGITLFDAMRGVAKGKYGLVSDEFRKTIADIEGGIPQIEALNRLAMRIVSLEFRRAIWQLISAMKSGADIGGTLDSIVHNLAQSEKIKIRKYGQELNPFAMMYMLFAVILPSLGITFLIIFSSFGTIFMPIYVILGIVTVAVVGFQVFFINFIRTRRPEVSV